MIIVMLKNIEK